MKRIALGLVFVAVAATQSLISTRAAGLYFPPATGEWARVQPSAAGWDERALNAALDFAGTTNSSGVVVLLDGRILAERRWAVTGADRYSQMVVGKTASGDGVEDVASAQKSVVAFLAGVAEGKRQLDLSAPVDRYLGKGWSKAPASAEAAITVRHLMTMTSGLNDAGTYQVPAGQAWRYNTGMYSRMIGILEKAAGSEIEKLTEEWLTKPAGMSDSKWARRWSTGNDAANTIGFATTARDLARFGLLVLAQGSWNGRDLLQNAGYLGRMLKPSQDLNPSVRAALVAERSDARAAPGPGSGDAWFADSGRTSRPGRGPGRNGPEVLCGTEPASGRHASRRADRHQPDARPEVGRQFLGVVDQGRSVRGEQMIRPILFVIASLLAAGNAAAQSESGRAAFERSCSVCHGQAGQGRLAPALVPFTRGSQELLRIVRAGAGTMMNGFSAAEVSDADVGAIGDYLRGLTPAAGTQAGTRSGTAASGPVTFGTSAVPTASPSAARRSDRTVEWPFVGADQNNSRYSALEDITAANVDRLEIAWRWRPEERALPVYGTVPGNFTSTPIMIDNMIYVTSNYNRVAALDAETGAVKWVYDPRAYEIGMPLLAGGFRHRGVAAWKGFTGRQQAAHLPRKPVSPVLARRRDRQTNRVIRAGRNGRYQQGSELADRVVALRDQRRADDLQGSGHPRQRDRRQPAL